MSDETRSWSRIGLGLVGYAAVGILFLASAVANFRYGLVLARDPVDKAAYGAASCAVDLLKACLLILAVMLWRRQHRLIASASVALWLACVAWSLSSAIGFALTTRADANVGRAHEHADKSGWSATVTRAEEQLSSLAKARPVAVVQADLAAVSIPPLIWKRSRQCTDMAMPEWQRACSRVTTLRRELAVAQVTERLEGTLTEARVVTSDTNRSDLQATALARITGLSEHDVRTGQSFLFAGIVELASALGFAIVGLAIGPKLSPRGGPHQTMKTPAEATLPEPSPVTEAGLNLHVASKPVPRSSKSVGGATTLMVRRSMKDPECSKDVEAFLQARTQSTEGGRVGSTNLHAAFNEYCRSHSLPERSQQALGKELSRLRLAKERCSRTGRVEYCGLALCGEHPEPISNGSSRAKDSLRHLIITKSTGKSNACH